MTKVEYQWYTGLINYEKYKLLGNSILNGYVKANGFVSVYIMTPKDFERVNMVSPSIIIKPGSM